MISYTKYKKNGYLEKSIFYAVINIINYKSTYFIDIVNAFTFRKLALNIIL